MFDDQKLVNGTRKTTRRELLKGAAGLVGMVFLASCTGGPATPAPTPTTAAAPTSAPGSTPAAAPTQAPAQTVNFPAGKPITVVVSAPAGGGTDVMVRTLQPYIEKELGTNLVIINNGTASGQAAATEVSQGPADGYTIGAISVPQNVQQAMDPERNPEYKVADIAWLACSVSDPCVLCVKPDSPYADAKAFIDAAIANPGQLNVSLAGKGSDDHFHMLDLSSAVGTEFNYVQFDGGGPARTALLGGHVDAWAGNEAEAVPLVQSGQIKVLWIANDKRSKYLPDVPTLQEVTGKEIIGYSQRGWYGPARMPAEIKKIYDDVFRKVHNDPEVIEKFDSMSYPIVYLDHAAWTEAVGKEMQRIERLVKEFGVFDPIPQPLPSV